MEISQNFAAFSEYMNFKSNLSPKINIQVRREKSGKGVDCRVVTFQNDVKSSRESNGAQLFDDIDGENQQSESETSDEGVR